MIKKLQFYISDTHNPYLNLAKEEFLFDTVDKETLILYLWQNKNTVVLGKNQNAFLECRTELLKAEGGVLARRLSGGGAVFHDLGNLNFTFICATENLDVSKHMLLIKRACASAGIEAELSGRNDILANGRKFSGNAFYNSKGRSYHHGTLLINADMEKLSRYLTPPKAKLESKGIKSVKSRVINLSALSPSLSCEDMKTHLLSAFEDVYGLTPEAFGELDEKRLAELSRRYESWEHLYGTPLPFNVVCEGRLSFGSVLFQICVKKGIVTALNFYTDALDSELSDTVKRALSSLPFEPSSIRQALTEVLPEPQAREIAELFEEQIF